MNKTLLGLVAVVIALGVAIYFFQGKVISVTPATPTPEPAQTAPTNTPPAKKLPPSMEDGTIEVGSTTTINRY